MIICAIIVRKCKSSFYIANSAYFFSYVFPFTIFEEMIHLHRNLINALVCVHIYMEGHVMNGTHSP